MIQLYRVTASVCPLLGQDRDHCQLSRKRSLFPQPFIIPPKLIAVRQYVAIDWFSVHDVSSLFPASFAQHCAVRLIHVVPLGSGLFLLYYCEYVTFLYPFCPLSGVWEFFHFLAITANPVSILSHGV